MGGGTRRSRIGYLAVARRCVVSSIERWVSYLIDGDWFVGFLIRAFLRYPFYHFGPYWIYHFAILPFCATSSVSALVPYWRYRFTIFAILAALPILPPTKPNNHE